MGVTEIDAGRAMGLEEGRDRGLALVGAHTDRFLDYIGALTPSEVDTTVPGLSWTVGETVTHVESVYLRYTTDLRRAATAADVAVQNGEDIERLGVDIERSVGTIGEQVAFMATVNTHLDPEHRFPFHAGVQTTPAGGWGNLLGELLAHGDDLARATGNPFGVPGEDLEIMWRFTAPLLEGWVRPECRGVDESWDLHLPFGDLRCVLRGGTLRWGAAEEVRPDHHEVTVDDLEAFSLAFPYRRRAVVDPMVSLLVSRFRDL